MLMQPGCAHVQPNIERTVWIASFLFLSGTLIFRKEVIMGKLLRNMNQIAQNHRKNTFVTILSGIVPKGLKELIFTITN
jgi:hypothetical protein